jgi:hypothetical protein
MDDIPFFSTEEQELRGGMWGHLYRGYESDEVPVPATPAKKPDAETGEEGVRIPGGLQAVAPSDTPISPPATFPSSSGTSESKETKEDVFASPSPHRNTKSLANLDIPSSAPEPTNESSTSLPIAASEPSNVTESAPTTPTHGGSTSNVMKRRTWFGSVRRSLGGEDAPGSVFGFPSLEKDGEKEKERKSRPTSMSGISTEVGERNENNRPSSVPPPISMPTEEPEEMSKRLDVPSLDVRIQPATPSEMIGDASLGGDDYAYDQGASGDEGALNVRSNERSRRWSDASNASAVSTSSLPSVAGSAASGPPSFRSPSPALSTTSTRSDSSIQSVGASGSGAESEGETKDEMDKRTKENTKMNSGGFLSGLRARNISALKDIRDFNVGLKEKDLKDVTEMIGQQALGVVKKWGWKGASDAGSATAPTQMGEASTTVAATPAAAEAGGTQSPSGVYLSLRDRVKERTGSNAMTSASLAEHLAAGGGGDSLRRASFGSAVSGSGSDRGRDTGPGFESSTSPISVPGHQRRNSRSSSPHHSATSAGSSSSAAPIHRSQPSVREMPRMTIPGIHSNHRGGIMAISSENVDKVITSPTSTPIKATGTEGKERSPPPLPPRRNESISLAPAARGTPSPDETVSTPTPFSMKPANSTPPPEAEGSHSPAVTVSASSETVRGASPQRSGSPAQDALKELVARERSTTVH